jgi:hypothetical protein
MAGFSAPPDNSIKFTQLERQRLKRLSYERHDATVPEQLNAA